MLPQNSQINIKNPPTHKFHKKRTSMPKVSAPEGELIGSSSKPWRIGKMIGEGACGSVHHISRASDSTNNTSDFVIKVAPYVKPALTKGKKRKKKTPMERNADLLLHENTLYKNVFNKLRGRIIPDVPIHGSPSVIPPGFGEIEGMYFGFVFPQ